MITCTQPGCTGSIVDGYCDICGSPGSDDSPSAATASVATASVATAMSPPPSARIVGSRLAPAPSGVVGACTQPGCTGQIADGYCDVCGSPGGEPAGATSSGGSVDTPPVGSDPLSSGAVTSSSRTSSRLDSAALGSKRASASGSKITKRIQSGSARLRSARLGAGLTRVPPAPEVDASQAVMTNPQVPEDKRTCPSCGNAVGRSRDGQPGRTEGFCPKCRNRFSFTPKLKAGDLVANQYEVAGCLAHGGLGWIYLARDRNVSNRWIVLKGLLNSGDADALAVAIIEQQFLAQVEHPLIVEIYNFVTHDEAGYIVMEYVGGTSLKQILKARMKANHGVYDPLGVDQAIAYILEALPAFQYLHDLGLVYCDFKPDNLIQVGDAVKLIDLGGVRRLDDNDSAIYGTIGYQAPEVAQVGTTIASDIYTIGRTLVVLMTEFRGYQTTYLAKLPPVDDTPLFQEHDSLYRLLLKACAPDPADRFASIDELRVQLLGVLREVVATKRSASTGGSGAGRAGTSLTSAASVLFEAPAITSDALEWDQLPALRPDTSDPQHAWLSNVALEDPAERLEALRSAPESSAEVLLARARAALELQQPDLVDRVVAEMLTADPWEWRAVWVGGLAALQRKDFRSAQSSYNAVYGQVPGELAPKLALALACERGGESDIAESLYGICAGTDANYVAPAAFGLARLRASAGDVRGAVDALDLVPSTSRGYTESRRQRARHLYQSGQGLPSLSAAMSSLDQVALDPAERALITSEILDRALVEVTAKGPQPQVLIGTVPAEDGALRDGLEDAYRRLAAAASDEASRHALVDRANGVRRWTLR